MIYPITFSIPSEKIVDVIPPKTKTLSLIVPGITNYIFHTEKEYYDEYKQSLFAITKKKAGWDCMRHYEIIANGCLPVFQNIEQCPENTMALLPKSLLKEIKDYYYQYVHNKELKDLNNDVLSKCSDYMNQLVEYLRKHLTTKTLARYLLDKSGHPNASRVLVLSGNLDPDYMRCLLLDGLKRLLGSECHDYPMVPHVYKGCKTVYHHLYGWGMTYSKNLDDSLHNFDYDSTVENDIKNKRYDVIVYGNVHRGLPYFDLVSQNYPRNKIILICGQDIHHCNLKHYSNLGYCCFLREW